MRNPYNNGGVISKDSAFYDRIELLDNLDSQNSGAYYIKGNRRIGKSSLLRIMEQMAIANSTVIPVYLNLDGARNAEEIHRFFRKALEHAYRHKKLPPFEAPEGFLEALSASVRHYNDQGIHYLLLIDEAETLMKLPDEILTILHRELVNMYDGLTVILSATNRLQALFKKTQEGVSFLDGFQMRFIGLFSQKDAEDLIRQTKNVEGEVKVSEEVMEQILKYAGTHPFLIQKLCLSLFRNGTLRPVNPEEDLVLDDHLNNFFDINFDQLDAEHQQVLLQFRWGEGLKDDKIRTTLTINRVRTILNELEQLGFLRRENGAYWVGNYFLGLWLAERIPDSEDSPPEGDSTSDSNQISTIMQKLNVFISYSHKDEDFKETLDAHLTMLKRSDKIAAWNDRAILAGTEWDAEIKHQLEEAHIILLLVSARFLASDYIWKKELTRAMERHDRGEARIIPIFIKECDWHGAPFGKLQGLPKDAKPIGDPDNDAAWKEVAKGVRAVVEALLSNDPAPAPPENKTKSDMDTQRIKRLIAEGKIKQALDLLPDDETGAALKSRYSRNEHGNNMGTLSHSEYTIELNRITLAVLAWEREEMDSGETIRPHFDTAPVEEAMLQSDYAAIIELLDAHMDSRPTPQYSALRQTVLHHLSQGLLPPPATVQGLRIVINELKKTGR